jgi:hypothetical protein
MLQAPRLLTDPLWRTTLRVVLLRGFAEHRVKNYKSRIIRSQDAAITSTNLLLELEMISDNDFPSIPTSRTYFEDDDGINLAMMRIAAKEKSQTLDKVLGQQTPSQDKIQDFLLEFMLYHGEVLMCPVSTYLRLYFLSISNSPFDGADAMNVKNVLKMNTNEFVEYLNCRSSNEWHEYAGFLEDSIAVVTRQRDEKVVFYWDGEMKEKEVLELVDILERRLCGALNDLGSRSRENETLYLNLVDELISIKVAKRSFDSAE